MIVREVFKEEYGWLKVRTVRKVGRWKPADVLTKRDTSEFSRAGHRNRFLEHEL